MRNFSNSDFSTISNSELFGYARRLYDSKQFETSYAAYTELARRGYIACYVFLGMMNLEGKGTQQDSSLALDWFKKAADVGSAEASYYCARLLEKTGRTEEGIKYLRTSASQAYAPAMCRLGKKLMTGCVVIPKNLENARTLLLQAASSGNVFAKREVARLLTDRGNSALTQIYGWLRLMAAVGEAFVIALVNPRSDRLKA